MKKPLLTERFQQLAGIKPLYELSMDNFNEQEELNPEELKNKLSLVKDKVANHPLMQKAIDKVSNNPRLFSLIQKAASKFGLNESLNEEEINLDAIITTAIKHKDKVNESDNDGGIVMSAMFGIPLLTSLLPSSLFDMVYKVIPGYGGSKTIVLAVAAMLVATLVVGVKRKIQGK